MKSKLWRWWKLVVMVGEVLGTGMLAGVVMEEVVVLLVW